MIRSLRLSPLFLLGFAACTQSTDAPGDRSGSGGAGMDPDVPLGSGGTPGVDEGSGGGSPTQPEVCTPACGVGQNCVNGACECASGMSECGSVCVDTMTDVENCGGCESPCAAGLLCSEGVCSDTCAPGLTDCTASCVDLLVSQVNCGACGAVCEAGTTCTAGACEESDPNPDPPIDCTSVTDECPFEGGLTHLCKTRFSLGINYAWRDFAADFGGLTAWSMGGVSQNSAAYAADLADMSDKGAQTVRWWMFPDFRGDGVSFDQNDNPTGITPQAISDIQMALDLAEAQDVYIVFTIFSFDNFRPTRTEVDINVRGMSDMVRGADRRAAVIQNIVRPVAEAARASENSHRLLGWDVINEPEWAVAATGAAPSGGEFDPNPELDAVTLDEMKALINESGAVLKEVTPDALLSVGWAAAKWSWAFSDVTIVDFHQPHIYAWVNDYWPYTWTPSELGYSAKPTVMGEFYLEAMPFGSGPTYSDIVTSWYENGYAGAWSWQYNENFESLGLTETFAAAQGCSVRY